MSRKMVLAAACAALSLIPFAPARAKIIPVELHCTASGSADYLGNWEGGDVWDNIVATGFCVGGDPDTFGATLTGEGWQEGGVGRLGLNVVLSNTHSGRSAAYQQTWTYILGRAIIQASTRAPAGIGRVNIGPYFNEFSSQELAFAWTFLAFNTP